MELLYDPAIALLGIYPSNTKILIQRGTCTLMFIAELSTIAKLWKEPKCPSTDDKEDVVYIYIFTHTHTHTLTYYLVIQKNEILSFTTTCIELEGIMLSERSQRKAKEVKDKYVI